MGNQPRAGHSGPCDLVTVGETMVAFLREESGNERYRAISIGAESNVAIGFRQLGGTARWVSRLGDDELGRLVYRTVAAHGVDADVTWDTERQTGVCVKEVRAEGTSIRYYRSESAARGLTPGDVPNLVGVGVVHMTGITATFSDAVHELVKATTHAARRAGAKVSFDVNLRSQLWSSSNHASRRLLPLCRDADLVFVGVDEALALTGLEDPMEFAAAAGLSPHQEVVFKRGPGPATILTGGKQYSAAPESTKIVDVTGAGDAFAAGYLAASNRGLGPTFRLKWAHWNAARAVQVADDITPEPSAEQLRELSRHRERPTQHEAVL